MPRHLLRVWASITIVTVFHFTSKSISETPIKQYDSYKCLQKDYLLGWYPTTISVYHIFQPAQSLNVTRIDFYLQNINDIVYFQILYFPLPPYCVDCCNRGDNRYDNTRYMVPSSTQHPQCYRLTVWVCAGVKSLGTVIN